MKVWEQLQDCRTSDGSDHHHDHRDRWDVTLTLSGNQWKVLSVEGLGAGLSFPSTIHAT